MKKVAHTNTQTHMRLGIRKAILRTKKNCNCKKKKKIEKKIIINVWQYPITRTSIAQKWMHVLLTPVGDGFIEKLEEGK